MNRICPNKHVIYPRYHLSPHEQKAFTGTLRTGVIIMILLISIQENIEEKCLLKEKIYLQFQVPNTLWRIRSSVFTVAPPFLVTFLIYDWANKEYDR